MASSCPNSQTSQPRQSSDQCITSTPIRRSTRPPTPRKSLPGMVQPSADSRITIQLPTGSKRSGQAKRLSRKTPSTKSTAESSQNSALAPSRKRRDDLPPESEVNQDSDDGLTNRQKAKKAKILEVESEGEEIGPEYAPVEEYFGEPKHQGDDVSFLFISIFWLSQSTKAL
ncbi:hypothetical protein DFH28DRAFT_909132 [Melampsora americana]|nr:hypothetical protein DFH28DRAFT_909132 [Melampsora americana]